MFPEPRLLLLAVGSDEFIFKTKPPLQSSTLRSLLSASSVLPPCSLLRRDVKDALNVLFALQEIFYSYCNRMKEILNWTGYTRWEGNYMKFDSDLKRNTEHTSKFWNWGVDPWWICLRQRIFPVQNEQEKLQFQVLEVHYIRS